MVSPGNIKENMMKFDLTIPDAHLQAQRHFAVQSVKEIAPWIVDVRELRAHVRKILFGRTH